MKRTKIYIGMVAAVLAAGFGCSTARATEPTTQASAVNFTAVTETSMTVNWTNGNGANRIVVMKAGSAVDGNPIDGTVYTANAAFGSGSLTGTDNYVVYNSTGSSVTVTGLTPGTTYYVAVYEYNGSGGTENYLTASPAAGNQTTLATEPTTQASGVNFPSVSDSSMTVNWTRGGGANCIVLVKAFSAVDANPADGITYTANTDFTIGDQIGTGNYAVYNGTGSSVTVTGLTSGQTYHVAVYEYNGSGGTENYMTASPATGNKITTATEPTSQASAVNFTSVTGTSMTVNWTIGSGANRIVLVKSGSAVDSNPADGTNYTANAVFGSGDQIGTGNYVVHSGTGNTVTVTGLTPGVTYFVAVYEYNGSGGTENYLTTAPAVANVMASDTCNCALTGITGIPQIECEALVALYNSTTGTGWTDSSNWNTNSLCDNWFGVTVSAGNVTRIDLNTNNLIGTIPVQLENLGSLTNLVLHSNQLTGIISNFNMPNLNALYLYNNQLSGTIPNFNMPNLTILALYTNQLSGNIPNFNMPNLTSLALSDNQLTGIIPNFNMPNMTNLGLGTNQLIGTIPNFNMPNLTRLYLPSNQLSGDIPAALTNLISLDPAITDLGYNSLTASDPPLVTFLNSKDSDWAATQTIPPSNLGTADITANSIRVTWTPIPYTGDGGSYRVKYSTVSGGPYTDAGTTANKSAADFTVTGLSSGTTYYFVVETYTPAHANNTNALTSALSSEVSVATLTGEPTTQVSAVNFTAVSGTSMTINWTNGNGTNRIVLVKAVSAVDANPIDGTAYTANAVFSTGSQIGTGNYVVHSGTGNTVTVTGLTPGVTYFVAVYEYNGSGGTENYLTSIAPATGNTTTAMTPPGNALNFDGVDDYVSMNDWGLGTSDFTIEAWVYPRNPAIYLITNRTNHSSYAGNWYCINVNGTLTFTMSSSTIGGHFPTGGTIPIPYNQWSHIAVQREGATIRLFVNGMPDGEFTDSGIRNLTSEYGTNVFGVWNYSGTLNYPNPIQLDEVRIWNVARSQTNIQSNMYKTLAGNETGLVAYYNFDQGTDCGENTGINTLPDLTSGAHNGTLMNFALISGCVSNWGKADWCYGCPAVSTGLVSSVTPTTASVAGTLVDAGTSSVTASGVCYATTANPATPCTTGGFPASLSGLTQGTAYYARAYAVNSSGTSYGSDVTFATRSVPVIAQTSPVSASMDEDGSPAAWVTPTITATDGDGDILTWTLDTEASNGTANVSGTGVSPTVTYAPNANYKGTDSFAVKVSDADGTDTITVDVTVNAVNDNPATTGIADVTANEDAANTVIDLLTSFSDIEDGAAGLVYTVQSNTNSSLVTTGISGGNLTLAYTADASGTSDITVRGTDTGGLYAEAAFTVTVNAGTDNPTTTGISNVTVNEDSADTVIDLLTSFSDIEDGAAGLVYTVQSNTNPSLVNANISGSNLTLAYTADGNGTANITVRATDTGGLWVETDFTVTADPVDDPPAVSEEIPAAKAVIGDPPRTLDLSEFFTDIDNDIAAMTFSAVSSSDSLVRASVSEHILTLTFPATAAGEARITVTAYSGGKSVSYEFPVRVNPKGYRVSGKVTYFSSNIGVPGIEMILEGLNAFTGQTETYVAKTSADGSYIFPDAVQGEYSLSPSKDEPPNPENLSAQDARNIALAVLDRTPLSGIRLKVMDVNGNGRITGLDASNLARFAVYLLAEMSDTGKPATGWQFEPESLNFSLNADTADLNFAAGLTGDVSGNYIPGTEKKRASSAETWEAFLLKAAEGDMLSLPLVLTQETDIQSFDIRIEYDPDMLVFSGLSREGGILEDESYQFIANTDEPGIIRIAVYSAWETVRAQGTLAIANFAVRGAKPSSVLRLARFDCREIPVSVPLLPECQNERSEILASDTPESEITGGLYFSGAVFREAWVQLQGYDDVNLRDLDGDGRIGLGDAVLALLEGNLEGAIRALQCAAGLISNGMSQSPRDF